MCGLLPAFPARVKLHSMSVSPARAAAFDILFRVEREGSYASELLHSASYRGLSDADHALTTELVLGVLRWRSRLDDEIAAASSQQIAKLDLEVLLALRLAVYQLRYLDRIPARAALNESVELAKRARKRSAAAFVNAVLRKLSAQTKSDKSSTTGSTEAHREGSPQSIARAWAHPEWMVKQWMQEYGLEVAEKICRSDQSIPTTAIRLRTAKAERELAAEGISLGAGALLSSARRVQAGDITKTRTFREGQIAIQDEASQLVAALVSTGERGLRILDCCAAPGGKTLAIADQNPDAEITAIELHPHRARLMQKLRPDKRIAIVVADARALPTTQRFDRVLADVPCSGTGTLARNPEIKWRLKPADLSELHQRQVAILRSALNQLAPGGRLVYSTCSLEREENEDVVTEVLSGNETVRVIDCREELVRLKAAGILTWTDPSSLTCGPYLRTIPGLHPCDGFFAVILEKSKHLRG